jgi:cyanate lyase
MMSFQCIRIGRRATSNIISSTITRQFSAAANTVNTTARLLQAKLKVGLSFEELAKACTVHEVFLASAVYGQNSLSMDTAKQLLSVLKLDPSEDPGKDHVSFHVHAEEEQLHVELLQALVAFPLKTGLSEAVPTDPLIYRFHEITQIYGMSIKAIIQEKMGQDGIMSAIDFSMDIKKQEDPKGDRVVVTYNGKFLPYNKW